MEKFVNYSSVVIPIDRSNVDTDALIPKQFLKSVEKSGFGDNLFDEWRYLDQGEPGQDCSDRPLNTDFVLNKKAYRGGRILLARENFGCGSSREHAVWALRDFGIRTVIAGSYADIFFNNCFKNGVLPISLPGADIDALFAQDASLAHVRWISISSAKRRRLNRDRFTVSKLMASKNSAFWKVWTISH